MKTKELKRKVLEYIQEWENDPHMWDTEMVEGVVEMCSPQWTSVEDSLPEEEGHYLCLRGRREYVYNFKFITDRDGNRIIDPEVGGLFVNYYGSGVGVDYWMPLPNKPKTK